MLRACTILYISFTLVLRRRMTCYNTYNIKAIQFSYMPQSSLGLLWVRHKNNSFPCETNEQVKLCHI